jgi:hypothetical protein
MTTLFHLVQRLRIREVSPPQSLYASIEWCFLFFIFALNFDINSLDRVIFYTIFLQRQQNMSHNKISLKKRQLPFDSV